MAKLLSQNEQDQLVKQWVDNDVPTDWIKFLVDDMEKLRKLPVPADKEKARTWLDNLPFLEEAFVVISRVFYQRQLKGKTQ